MVLKKKKKIGTRNQGLNAGTDFLAYYILGWTIIWAGMLLKEFG